MRQVSDLLGVAYSTVRTIAKQAERAGLIVRYPDSYPHFFYDPVGVIGGYDTNYHRVMEKTDAEKLRISRIHTNGTYVCDVLHEGEKKQINHDGKVAIIWQNEPSYPKGRTDYYGAYRVDDQHIKFCYRIGKHSVTFAFWTGDVYLSGADAFNRGEKILLDRVKWVIKRLRSTGWRLSDPILKGCTHSAKPDERFAQYCKRVDDNAPVQFDKSTGTAELEVFDNEDNNIISYLPEHIKALNARMDAIEELTGKLVTITENLTQALVETTSHTTHITSTIQQPTGTPETDYPAEMYQ